MTGFFYFFRLFFQKSILKSLYSAGVFPIEQTFFSKGEPGKKLLSPPPIKKAPLSGKEKGALLLLPEIPGV
jgi:hypothetical protein